MTGFELLMFGAFIGMIITIIIVMCCIVYRGDKNDKPSNNNKNNSKDINEDVYTRDRNRNTNISDNNWLDWCDNRHDKLYKDGKITNIATMYILDNIKREMFNTLSNVEKDALDNAIKNTLSIEKLNIFINCKGDVE